MIEAALLTMCSLAVALASGSAAYVAAQVRHWRADERLRANLRTELTAMLKKFTDEHNKLVYQVAELHDKMGIIDMKVSGVAGKPHAAPRKF